MDLSEIGVQRSFIWHRFRYAEAILKLWGLGPPNIWTPITLAPTGIETSFHRQIKGFWKGFMVISKHEIPFPKKKMGGPPLKGTRLGKISIINCYTNFNCLKFSSYKISKLKETFFLNLLFLQSNEWMNQSISQVSRWDWLVELIDIYSTLGIPIGPVVQGPPPQLRALREFLRGANMAHREAPHRELQFSTEKTLLKFRPPRFSWVRFSRHNN